MKKQDSPLVFRLEPELHARLEESARRLRLKKYSLAILAIEAAVEAIEKNDYRLVVPIEFTVSQVPVPADIEALADQITEDEARQLGLRTGAGALPAILNEATAPAGSKPLPKQGTAGASAAPKVSYRKPPSKKRP